MKRKANTELKAQAGPSDAQEAPAAGEAPSSSDQQPSGSEAEASSLQSDSASGASSSSGDSLDGGASSSDSDSDSDSEGGSPQQTIDVSLEFYDPKEIDFHGLRALLQTYLDGKAYNCSELVDTVIQQSTVGTVVKTGEGVDPIGVLTVLNTRRYSHLTCLAEIKAFLLQQCSDKAVRNQLQTAWEAPDTGLLVSERLLNCPPQLAPPLQQALFEEVSWATEDEPTQELRDSYKLQQYILVSRVYTDPTAGAPPAKPAVNGAAGSKANKKHKAAAAAAAGPGGAQPLLVYARPEDEFFHKHAQVSYTFPIEGKAVAKDELQPLRLVVLIGAAAAAAARRELDRVVGNVASGQAPAAQ